MMFTKKTFKSRIIVFLFVVPMLAIDMQPVSEDIVVSQDDQNEHQVIMQGNASYGNKPITGKACVVMNSKQLKKKKVGKGDIVIAPAIHSTWYSELMDVSGIIVEKGDDTSHAIALGKKLDIPVIVGAVDATKKIVDGQTIACDPITRNVYHIAYPDHQNVHFDTLVVPARGQDSRSLYEKITKPGQYTPRPSREYSDKSDKSDKLDKVDKYLPTSEDRTIQVVENVPKYKPKRITKDVYLSHFDRFKKFILGERSKFVWTRDWLGMSAVEAGARTIGKCDDFSVECISIGEPFYDSKDSDIDEILRFIGQSPEHLELIDKILDQCSQKPKDLNWVAYVSHKEHINAIKTPSNVNKEDLIKHPKEYKKIEDKVDKKERLRLIVDGLFGRYWVSTKLPL